MNIPHDAPTASPARLSRRTLFGGIGVLLGDALLAACGGYSGAQVPESPPPTVSGPAISTSIGVPSNGPLSALAPAPPPPAASPTAGAMPTITQANNGTTVNLAAGRQVLLALDSGHDWVVTVEDVTVLTPVVGAVLPPGTQGVYTASQPGRTTLTAVGEPLCRKAQPPCGAPTLRFRVRIAVT